MAKDKRKKNSKGKDVDVVEQVNKNKENADEPKDKNTEADTVKQSTQGQQKKQAETVVVVEESKPDNEEPGTQETLVGAGQGKQQGKDGAGNEDGNEDAKETVEEKKVEVAQENKEENRNTKADDTEKEHKQAEHEKKQDQHQPQPAPQDQLPITGQITTGHFQVPKPVEQPLTATQPSKQQPKTQQNPPNPQVEPISVKEEQQELSYRNELEDGLRLVGQAFEQTVYQNPLAHEQVAHGVPEFTEKFEPATFHLIERMLQEANIKTPERNTPEKKTPQKPKTPPRNAKVEDHEALQEIKQSAESIDPDPMELQYGADSKIVNVLKSLHSDSDDDEKKKAKLREKSRQKQIQKEKQRIEAEVKSRKSSQASSRKAIINPPQNPSFINPLPTVLPPVPAPANLTQNEIVSEKAFEQPKHELNFDEINKQMLKQREIQWQKLQEKQLEARRPSIVLVQPENQLDTSAPVKPHAPEKLPYTNNLPIITQERTQDTKQKLRKQSTEIKEKLNENDKLRKDMEKSDPIKKFGVSVLVGAACLGACVLGKVDKRVTAGASIAGVILSFLAQK